MSTYVDVAPAYGRDYKSQKAVRADWEADKDFQVVGLNRGGRYINKADADREQVAVTIRYDQLRKVMVIYPGTPKAVPASVVEDSSETCPEFQEFGSCIHSDHTK